MLLANAWKDYELIDAANGEKLERWGDKLLIRPDPQVIWTQKSDPAAWERACAHYHRSRAGGGGWSFARPLPDVWRIGYPPLTFLVRPTGFKHTGLFPEQAVNWEFIMDAIGRANREISVLNLFAYTGGATMAAAKAGARVVHVDAAKGMVLWAKENAGACGLKDAPIRYIVDDAIKFAQREIRRGHTYDCIIMDPPSYGRGPNGEVWKFEDALYDLVTLCAKLLSPKPLCLIVNSYTSSVSPTIVANVLFMTLVRQFGGRVENGELCLPITASGLQLPCGATTRWICE